MDFFKKQVYNIKWEECITILNERSIFIMPDIFYEEMDKMFKELGIQLETTDDTDEIKHAESFIAVFTPDFKPIIIE